MSAKTGAIASHEIVRRHPKTSAQRSPVRSMMKTTSHKGLHSVQASLASLMRVKGEGLGPV